MLLLLLFVDIVAGVAIAFDVVVVAAVVVWGC